MPNPLIKNQYPGIDAAKGPRDTLTALIYSPTKKYYKTAGIGEVSNPNTGEFVINLLNPLHLLALEYPEHSNGSEEFLSATLLPYQPVGGAACMALVGIISDTQIKVFTLLWPIDGERFEKMNMSFELAIFDRLPLELQP